jgi:hypothetical protein
MHDFKELPQTLDKPHGVLASFRNNRRIKHAGVLGKQRGDLRRNDKMIYPLIAAGKRVEP